ncbi:hypothetical protein LJC17_00540 [Acholeplasma sp. OttesenSCG-928-E16]|nr:hypothetical protein [Acholeplasma sp. OttesenSCG-928-E16]
MKKKIVSLLLMALLAVAFIGPNAQYQAAEGDLKDFYPYENAACVGLAEEGAPACNASGLTASNWVLEYDGGRYHFLAGLHSRMLSQYAEAINSKNGLVTATEIGGSSGFNAFATLYHNDSGVDVIVQIDDDRTKMTAVRHAVYVYFDENGVLQMAEYNVQTFYLTNEGTEAAPDYRFSTAEEIAAIPTPAEGESAVLPDGMVNSTIRIIRSDNERGYKVEPITFTKWTYTGYNPEDATTKASILFPDKTAADVNNIEIPAGWNVISFGTRDRAYGYAPEQSSIPWVNNLAYTVGSDKVAWIDYLARPASFSLLSAIDVDAEAKGIQGIIDYRGSFSLVEPTASWTYKVVDPDTGFVSTKTDKLDYKVVVSDGTNSDTLTFAYDSAADAYVKTGEVTIVDTMEFNKAYTVTYSADLPESYERPASKEVVVNYIVGTLPPRFHGVENKIYSEYDFNIDVLDGITADDGEVKAGVADLTSDIVVTYPDGFNPYAPKPGVWIIELSITKKVEYPATLTDMKIKDVLVTDWDPADYNTIYTSSFGTKKLLVIDNNEDWQAQLASGFHFAWSGNRFHILVIGTDGKVKTGVARSSWITADKPTGGWAASSTLTSNLAAITLAAGEFIVVGRDLNTDGAPNYAVYEECSIAGLNYGDKVELIGLPYEAKYVTTETSFKLTVDDKTAPTVVVGTNRLVIYSNDVTNLDDAIKANVFAIDNSDEELAIYISNKPSGMSLNNPGVYQGVEVTVEDAAGLATKVTFTVEIKAPNASAGELEEEKAQLEEQIDDLNDALKNANDKIKDLEALPASLPVWASIVISVGAAALAFGAAWLVLRKRG